jgi:lysophospholipase L1-like esterase
MNPLRPTVLLAPLAAGWGAAQVLLLRHALLNAKMLRQRARPFEAHPSPHRARVLLVGDSTGVGVGAGAPEQSLPGLLARRFPGVAIVNTCRNGARVADVAAALARGAPGAQRFDVALVLLGGNDVVHLTPQRELEQAAAAVLHELHWHARRIVWLGSANIGHAPIMLPPLSWWARRRCRRTMSALAQVARAHGVTFIDFCEPRLDARFAGAPGTTFARDGLHPSSTSYLECFHVLEQRVPLHAWLSGTTRSQTPIPPPEGMNHAVDQ